MDPCFQHDPYSQLLLLMKESFLRARKRRKNESAKWTGTLRKGEQPRLLLRGAHGRSLQGAL